ncbi:MAG: hypothetical protein AB1589_43540, partial [Cyanobacteriota bacterium]
PNPNSITELPESVATALLQNVSQQSGVPVSDLRILGAQRVTWRDGCMGLSSRNTACTLALVEGWRVVVQSNDQMWVYHTNGSRFLLAIGAIPTPIPEPPTPLPQPTGTSQENPILPDITELNMWEFRQVSRGLWFDPPTAYGFQYKMTSNSLFTEILDFPTGFKKPFAVLVKDILLGEFTAGNRLNFTDYSALLGNLLIGGRGVKEFTVAGLNVDPTNPAAFPIKLDFNTDVAGFNMYALTNNAPAEEVPEPLSILGTLTFSTFLAAKVYQRKQKRSV